MTLIISSSQADMAPNSTLNGNSDADPQAIQLLHVSKTVLKQAIDLLDNHLTSDDQLTVHSKYLPGSTIGKHLRHARDHFVLLVDSVAATSPHILNYDVRSRNTPMESSIAAAKEALADTITVLEQAVPQADMEQPMTLNAVTPYSQTFQTTFGRELWFAALHCVHHWSMVRVIAGELDITLSEDFGFAPSTLVHQGKEAPLGKAKI
ncbi:hypothetical protein ONZ45_g10124 [Pleurotus djamor]|nr:hypothetical protein ONZ45_g10124 [Pleurotus djamor]